MNNKVLLSSRARPRLRYVIARTRSLSWVDLDAQLRYEGQVRSPELLSINVAIYVYGVSPPVPSHHLNEILAHASPSQPCCEPVPARARRTRISAGGGI